MGIFVPIAQMYLFRDQRKIEPGSRYGPYGTQSTDRPSFFMENAFSMKKLNGEMFINLGLAIMKEIDDHCDIQWLADNSRWGRRRPRLHDQGAGIMEALCGYDFRRMILAGRYRMSN